MVGMRRGAAAWRLCALVWALLGGAPAQAQVAPAAAAPLVTMGDWGGAGLLQMRTARFEADGQFNVGYSFADPYKRYSFNLTYFPWVEATFRYTEVRSLFYSQVPSFSGDQRYKDRGADLKFRLLEEGRFRPALAVGFQDLLGTGLFAGEYVVASKRIGDLDLTAGIGWGTIGSAGNFKNPMLAISDRFAIREGAEGTGGQIAFLSLFGGERVGLFGGVEYQTPLRGLSLKVEYDTNSYATREILKPPTRPINFGAVFRPYDWFELSVGRERGNTTMLRFTLRTNFNDTVGVPKINSTLPPIAPRRPLSAFTPTPQVEEVVRPIAVPATAPAPAAPPVPPAAALPPRRGDEGRRVEAFYAELDRQGANLESIVTVGQEAYLAVVATRPDSLDLQRMAQEALAMLPPDVVAVLVSDMTPGMAGRLYRAEHPHAAREPDAGAEALYRLLGEDGLEIQEVVLIGDTARVQVTPADGRTPDLQAAARIAAQALPGSATVTVQTPFGAFATWPPLPFAGNLDLALAPLRAPTAVAGQEIAPASPEPVYTAEQRRVVEERVNDGLRRQGIVLEFVNLEGRHAEVGLYLFRYREFARNVGLAARVVANALPAPVEVITIAFLNGGVELSRVTFLRHELEAAAGDVGTPEDFWLHTELAPGEPWWDGTAVPWRYPRYSWSLGPQLRQHIGGPDRFYLYQLWLSLSGSIDVARGLTLSGQVGKNVYHGFDRIRLRSDSSLPHVRSQIKEYLQQGADNIVRLQATYLLKPAEDLYVRFSGGLLEEMFGGVSGEVLYQPFGSRLALGLELSKVQQRDYDQRFKFRDYKVTTGHVSLYYDTPFRNVLAVAHMGHYLAGDRGVTFELSRRFDSGVRVGAWATFTNVTAQQFGEGSFDKGFFIVIPFELFLTRSSAATGVFAFRPLTRDGGQRLSLANRLYDLTAQGNLGSIGRGWAEVMR